MYIGDRCAADGQIDHDKKAVSRQKVRLLQRSLHRGAGKRKPNTFIMLNPLPVIYETPKKGQTLYGKFCNKLFVCIPLLLVGENYNYEIRYKIINYRR